MTYAAWSVIFGEQPSAAKWNVLGSNDASFNDGTGIANLALNTTAISNPYKFYAYRNAAWTSANGKINLDAELYDTNNNFDSTTNYRYTVPVDGWYAVYGATTSAQSNGTGYGTLIYKNGAVVVLQGVQIISAFTTSFGMTTNVYGLIQLTAGDYLELYHVGGASVAGGTGAVGTYMCGNLVCRT